MLGHPHFQKSRWSSPDREDLLCKCGNAKRLLSFDDEPVEKAPAYYSCISQARAEQFDPGCRVGQWTVRNDDDVSEVVAHLTNSLRRFVIPSVKSTMSEASLLSKWSGTDLTIGNSRLELFSWLQMASSLNFAERLYAR